MNLLMIRIKGDQRAVINCVENFEWCSYIQSVHLVVVFWSFGLSLPLCVRCCCCWYFFLLPLKWYSFLVFHAVCEVTFNFSPCLCSHNKIFLTAFRVALSFFSLSPSLDLSSEHNPVHLAKRRTKQQQQQQQPAKTRALLRFSVSFALCLFHRLTQIGAFPWNSKLYVRNSRSLGESRASRTSNALNMKNAM